MMWFLFTRARRDFGLSVPRVRASLTSSKKSKVLWSCTRTFSIFRLLALTSTFSMSSWYVAIAPAPPARTRRRCARQQGRVGGVSDGHGRHRHAPRHLQDGVHAVHAVEVPAAARARQSPAAASSPRPCPGQVRGAARAGDDAPQPAPGGVSWRTRTCARRRAVRGHHRDLDADAEALQRLRGGRHRGQVRVEPMIMPTERGKGFTRASGTSPPAMAKTRVQPGHRQRAACDATTVRWPIFARRAPPACRTSARSRQAPSSAAPMRSCMRRIAASPSPSPRMFFITAPPHVQRDVAQRPAEHGAQVRLVLAARRRLDGVMP